MLTTRTASPAIDQPRTRRWTYSEFERLGELGFFRQQRVELVGGKIIKMAPQKDVHTAVVSLARRVLERVFGDAFWVRTQSPLQIGRWSGPEPDVSVVPGNERNYIGTGHPKTALLVIEVSDTTLKFDRQRKAALYAKAGILDYWVLNLIDRQLEVYRDPVADASARYGYRYGQPTILKCPATVSPLAMPSATLALADMLP